MSQFELDLPEQYNASELLFHNLEAGRRNKVAIYCESERVTYGQLAEMANRVGNGLKGLDIPPGSRIMMLLLDTPAFPATFFGAVKADYVPITTNTTLPASDYEYFLNDSNAQAIVVDVSLYPAIDGIRSKCPGLKHVIVVRGCWSGPAGLVPNTIDWDHWLAAASPELETARTHKDDHAFWMYSSGSTGRPKGTPHLQHDIRYTTETYAKQVLGIRTDDIAFSIPKLYFAYGFGNAMTFPYSVGGSTVLYPGRPTPDAVFSQIERYRPTLLFAVPTLYVALLAAPGSERRDLSSLRLCLSAAESLPAEVYRQWHQRYGVEILEGCGSTELLHIYISNMPGRAKLGATGCAVPGYEIKLLDESGQPVPMGEAGDMLVRGDSAAPYYWNRPDKTKHTMRGDWIFTGDRFLQDEEGYYHFAGRSDDMIKVSGMWVSPVEVENTLIEHPAVLESAVIAVRDEADLVKSKAFVVLRQGGEPSAALVKELQEFCKSRMAPYKYPRIVEFVDELPKTATGKIQRFRLREREEQSRS